MNKQKILIVGAGGGREHAVGWKIAQSPRVEEIFFASGNAGTASIGINLDIKPSDISGLINYVKNEKIDLTLVVSDEPLSLGVVDKFRKNNLRVFGTTKMASQLEWSKVFSKNFMQRHNLPTAKWQSFSDYAEALLYLDKQNFPLVIKADGLAFGKGVLICQSRKEADEALDNIFIKKIFGDSGNEVVIEEFLTGSEISIHVFSDGKNCKIFPPSQDHKRIGDNDTGLNTGGMGAIAPLPFVDEKMMQRIEKEIVAPALKGMADGGMPFEGVLYPGLMLTPDGPKIIEFNARMGDPEAEVYMRLLDTDLLDIVDACIDGKLDEIEIRWKNAFACNVVLASGGYPENYEKGKVITGMNEAEKESDIVIFHAGTKIEDNNIITNGGRVLGVSAIGNTLQEALDKAYKAIEKISFEGMQYRKDIGKKALKLSL